MGTDYRRAATDYALREIVGTDRLAFRMVAQRVSEMGLAGAALDVGCGAGRSTRFLKSLGFRAEGVDASEAMIVQARQRDSSGEYQLVARDGVLPFGDADFDVVLSTWVVVEIDSNEVLRRLLAEIRRVLKSGGTAFIVANTAEFYSGRWVSCEVDFPENAPQLRSGQCVKTRLMPEGVVVTDTFWTESDYRESLSAAGLRIAQAWKPVAPRGEIGWQDESSVPPWVIFEAAV
jgi:ubiquinone/menaquinone biosynthesis C-methylase UbiE